MRKIRQIVVVSMAAIVVVTAMSWYLSRPKPIEQFVVHQVPPSAHSTDTKMTRVFLRLPTREWLLRLGPTNQSQLPMEKFSCVEQITLGSKICTFQETAESGNFQILLVIDGGIIRRYSILSFDADERSAIIAQLSNLFGEFGSRFPSADRVVDEIKLENEYESVRLLTSHPKHGTRPYLSVVVSLK